jgi:hypothetical protein
VVSQIIKKSEYRPIKYHGQVKFLVFECNNCHKEFSRQESYARKQVKIHKNACTFCSPLCRTAFFKGKTSAVKGTFEEVVGKFGMPTETIRSKPVVHVAADGSQTPPPPIGQPETPVPTVPPTPINASEVVDQQKQEKESPTATVETPKKGLFGWFSSILK